MQKLGILPIYGNCNFAAVISHIYNVVSHLDITSQNCEKGRWSSLQNKKSRGRSWIQIHLLPPYIYLTIPKPTHLCPLSPNPTPNPTHLHPLYLDPTPPPGSHTAMRCYWKKGPAKTAISLRLTSLYLKFRTPEERWHRLCGFKL